MSEMRGTLKSVGAKRRDQLDLPVGKLYFPSEGTPLFHSRSKDPVSEALVALILADGRVKKSIIVWEQVAVGGEVTQDGTVLKKGQGLFIVGDGCRRARAAFRVQSILLEGGQLQNTTKEFFVPIELFVGNEKEFLLLRQAEDTDPSKLPHKPSAIACNFRQAAAFGATVKDMLSTLGHDYDRRIVEHLLRWQELPQDVADGFDNGVVCGTPARLRPVPIALLPVFLERVPREEMMPALKTLVEKGYQHYKGASKYFTAQARQAAQDDAESSVDSVDPADLVIYDDGDDHTAVPEANPDGNGAKSAGTKAGAANGKSGSTHQRTRSSTVRKGASIAAAKADRTAEEAMFWVGAVARLGDPEDVKLLLRALGELPGRARHILAGMMYSNGFWPAAVQKHVQPGVLESIGKAGEKPAPKVKGRLMV